MDKLNNNKWLTVFILLLVTANIVTLSLLWINKGGKEKEERRLPPPPGGQVFEFINHELKLDSSQREAYRKLRDEHQAKQQLIQDSVRKLKDAFFALLQQPAIADSAVEAGAKRITAMEEQLELITFRHFQQVRVICTPDQQKKFDTIIQDVLRRMAPPKNRQGPPPPGREREGPGRFPPPPGPDNEPPKPDQ